MRGTRLQGSAINTSADVPTAAPSTNGLPAVKLCEVDIETHNLCTPAAITASMVRNDRSQITKQWMSETVFEKCAADPKQIDYSEQVGLFANNEPLLDKRLLQPATIDSCAANEPFRDP